MGDELVDGPRLRATQPRCLSASTACTSEATGYQEPSTACDGSSRRRLDGAMPAFRLGAGGDETLTRLRRCYRSSISFVTTARHERSRFHTSGMGKGLVVGLHVLPRARGNAAFDRAHRVHIERSLVPLEAGMNKTAIAAAALAGATALTGASATSSAAPSAEA